MKRILSLLLVAVMLVGLFPSTLAADSNPEPRSLNATELTGLSRLDEEKQEPAENRQETPGYQPEDLVTVIVTLTDEPVGLFGCREAQPLCPVPHGMGCSRGPHPGRIRNRPLPQSLRHPGPGSCHPGALLHLGSLSGRLKLG